jgi:predicted TIM-barrel fold metal-dependent hydrolase
MQDRSVEGIDVEIVDADFHLHLPVPELFEYVENPTVRDKLEAGGAPAEPSLGWKGGEYSTASPQSSATFHGVAVDREEIRETADKMGIDTVIVEPGTNMPFAAARYPPVKNELVRAYHDYVVDRVIDVENDIYATIVVPYWDSDVGVEELGRLGHREGFVAAQGGYSKMRPWGAPENDLMFERLTDLDLPLALHPFGISGRFDPLSDAMRTWTEVNVVSLSHNMMANVMNLLMTGVFEKYPSLRVVVQEAGTTWIPYVAHRADEMYQTNSEDVQLTERMLERGETHLEHMPSEYIYENMYVTTQPIIALPEQSRRIESLFDLCRAKEMFVFSSDFPHNNMDHPDWLTAYPGISNDMRARIGHENAHEAYRLPN